MREKFHLQMRTLLNRNFILKKQTMRKLVLAVLLAASFTGLYAQKLDDVKEKVDKQKCDDGPKGSEQCRCLVL